MTGYEGPDRSPAGIQARIRASQEQLRQEAYQYLLNGDDLQEYSLSVHDMGGVAEALKVLLNICDQESTIILKVCKEASS